MLKNAMNYLGEIAAGGLGHGNGDEPDGHSPTANDHIVGSVVDVGGIQVRASSPSTFASPLCIKLAAAGPSSAPHRRGRLRLRLRRGAERRRAPDGPEEAACSRRGEEETDCPGMFSCSLIFGFSCD